MIDSLTTLSRTLVALRAAASVAEQVRLLEAAEAAQEAASKALEGLTRRLAAVRADVGPKVAAARAEERRRSGQTQVLPPSKCLGWEPPEPESKIVVVPGRRASRDPRFVVPAARMFKGGQR